MDFLQKCLDFLKSFILFFVCQQVILAIFIPFEHC